MHVNKTKFERNGSLKCYHMACIGKKAYKLKRSIGIPSRKNHERGKVQYFQVCMRCAVTQFVLAFRSNIKIVT